MKDPHKERAIFQIENYEHYRGEAEFLAPCVVGAVMEVLEPESVVDLGCGLGHYLQDFADLGVEVRGYEFSPDAITHTVAPKGAVEYHDLTRALFSHRRFDLCMCVQVAEHIDGRFADHLVHIATDMSDVVYWSAARPGAGGQHHVNEQWADYWHELFERRRYAHDEELTKEIKKEIKKRCPRVGWGHHIYTDCAMYVNVKKGVIPHG